MSEKALSATRRWVSGGLACLGFITLAACASAPAPAWQAQVDGDPERGRDLMRSYGCHTCHTIPGVLNAHSLAGPSLADWADHSFIAGDTPNTPENLMQWLVNPQAIAPQTAMPNLGISEADARDLSAYLYTLSKAW